MRGILVDKSGKRTIYDFYEENPIRSSILDTVALYFVLDKCDLIELINKGEIEYIEHNEEDTTPEDVFSRAREELTINTLNWHIERDLKHFRERDERITRADVMEAYLKAIAVFNVNWATGGKDYSFCDTADYLYEKGFTI